MLMPGVRLTITGIPAICRFHLLRGLGLEMLLDLRLSGTWGIVRVALRCWLRFEKAGSVYSNTPPKKVGNRTKGK